MDTTQLSEIDALADAVENSTIDDTTILPDSGDKGKFERIAEIPTPSDSVEITEIPKHLLFDENGEHRVCSGGLRFDPEHHATDENGHPKLTSAGKLRKKRGRKSNSLSKTNASQELAKAAVNEKAKYKAVGAGAANALISLGMVLGGEDFTPISNQYIDEKQNLESAFTQWAETQEVEDIPPNLGLLIVVGSYILPRLTMPKQVSKFAMLKEWLRLKFTKTPKGKVFDPNKEKEE